MLTSYRLCRTGTSQVLNLSHVTADILVDSLAVPLNILLVKPLTPCIDKRYQLEKSLISFLPEENTF